MLGLGEDFSSLVSHGLLSPELKLYEHQLSTLKAATEGRNFIVTAGTGSGKTEARRKSFYFFGANKFLTPFRSSTNLRYFS